MSASKIEWTDKVWNPVRGCSLVSAGCESCYAMKQAHRFSGKGQAYEGLTELGPHGPRWSGKVRIVPELLDEPLKWKKPCKVFVNSMSDLFHEDVPDEFIDQVFAVMGMAGQHTFQILTKRASRMLTYMTIDKRGHLIADVQAKMFGLPSATWGFKNPEKMTFSAVKANVWLGVSCEDQQTADERIPLLLQTPAAVRFISAEPLLGPIDLYDYFDDPGDSGVGLDSKKGLDWVIVGGESGYGARPSELGWIRDLIDQCKAAGVACFVKQLGANPVSNRNLRGKIELTHSKGGDWAEWPEDLRVREYPHGR